MKGIVYEIQIGKYKQIGSTYDLGEREYHHLNLLTQNKHYNKYLQRVYNKYKTATFVTLYEYETREEAYQKEQELLDQYYRQPGYVMESKFATGGSLSGEQSFMYGRKHSEETKQKIGAKHKGKILSEETKQKLRETRLGMVVCKDQLGNRMRVTREEYDKRSDLVGTSKGVERPYRKKQIQCLEDGKVFDAIFEAATYYKVPPGQISENIKGKRKKVAVKKYEGGLTFKLLLPD
jgi:hypothetical protein